MSDTDFTLNDKIHMVRYAMQAPTYTRAAQVLRVPYKTLYSWVERYKDVITDPQYKTDDEIIKAIVRKYPSTTVSHPELKEPIIPKQAASKEETKKIDTGPTGCPNPEPPSKIDGLTINERMMKIVKENKVKIVDLAEAMGRSYGGIRSMLIGNRRPNSVSLKAFCKVFDLTTKELVEGLPADRKVKLRSDEPEEPVIEPTRQPEPSSIEKDIAAKFAEEEAKLQASKNQAAIEHIQNRLKDESPIEEKEPEEVEPVAIAKPEIKEPVRAQTSSFLEEKMKTYETQIDNLQNAVSDLQATQIALMNTITSVMNNQQQMLSAQQYYQNRSYHNRKKFEDGTPNGKGDKMGSIWPDSAFNK